MSEKDELKKLILAAEKEVQTSKKDRGDSLRTIMKGDAISGKEPVSLSKKEEKPSTAGWEDWKLGKDPEETVQAKKRKVLSNIGTILVVLIAMVLLFQFHFNSIKDQKSRKTKSNLSLSKVRIVSDAKSKKQKVQPKIPANFSGVRNGRLYHEGKPSATRPPANTNTNPEAIGNVMEVRRKYRRKMREKEKAEALKGKEKHEVVVVPSYDDVLDLPPNASPRVKKYLKKKAENLAKNKDNTDNKKTSGDDKSRKTTQDGSPILAW